MQLRRPTRPYGFRSGRSQHNALDALYIGLERREVNWVLDLDVRTVDFRDRRVTRVTRSGRQTSRNETSGPEQFQPKMLTPNVRE